MTEFEISNSIDAEVSQSIHTEPEIDCEIPKPIPKDLSYISDRLQLIEPTQLYNLIQQYFRSGHDSNFLLIIDVRSLEQYTRDHIVCSRWCGPKERTGTVCSVPYDIEFETLEQLVIIDSTSVTNLDENSLACKYGIAIAPRLMMKIQIVMGGYERFSAEYPFLRTAKVDYTSYELANLTQLPTEITPLLLYIGSQEMMNNTEINRILKIKSHIFAFPKDEHKELKGISYLHFNFDELTDFNSTLNECFQFIESYRLRAERIMLACPLGINESAIIACGYIMRRHRIGLLKAYNEVKKCMHSIRPEMRLIRALLDYEKSLFVDGYKLSLEKDVIRLVRLESTPFYA